MNLQDTPPPAASARELARKLERLNRNKAERGLINESVRLDEAGGAPTFLHAHRQYVLTPDQVLTDYDFATGEPQAWRYVLPQESGGTAVAEIIAGDAGEHRMAEITEGLHPQLVRQAIDWLSQQAQLGDDTFELRSLTVPELLVDNLWLHPVTGAGDDLFVAVQPVNPELESNRLYTRPEMMNILKTIALRHRANAAFSVEG